MTDHSTYRYIVGGTLFSNANSYIMRQADHDLYEALTARKFCYVLNSRQTGKSSLRVRMESRLAEIGTSCAVLDFSVRDTQSQSEQWYADTFDELVNQFDLGVSLAWWTERKALSPVKRLSNFIEEVLLVRIPGNIVIFIDEIDSVLSLQFRVDDFFALIRAFCNDRADHPEYNRLTFALFGVATPSDLIQDKEFTPFNIGQAIQLKGFQFEEAEPLAKGLIGIGDSEAVLKQVLKWTNGQPFLTQRLCALIQMSEDFIPVGDEAECVEKLVRSRIIQNWEFQDEKGHLSHIRDRILVNDQQACFLLGLYQQILRQQDVTADHSPEQMKLCLSGLVVERHHQLKIHNQIYREVFNQTWVAEELVKKRRLYGDKLNKWFASGCQNDACLLNESEFQEAMEWAEDKNLSNEDKRFLAASADKLHRRKIKRLARQLTRRFIYFALLIILVFSLVLVLKELQMAEQQTERLQTAQLVDKAKESSNPRIGVLQALEAMQQFENQGRSSPDAGQVLYRQLDLLPRLLKTNMNHLDDVETIAFSPNGKRLVSTSLDGIAKVWDVPSGKEVKHPNNIGNVIGKVNAVAFSSDDEVKFVAIAKENTVEIRERKSWKLIGQSLELEAYVNAIAFSPDSKFIATATVDTVNLNQPGEDQITSQIWEVTSGNSISPLNQGSSVNALAFSPDGKLIVTASADGTAQVWETASGKPVGQLLKHKGAILDVAFSPDGKYVATASLDTTAAIWEVGSDRPFATLQHEQAVTAVSLSHDSKWVATASMDKIVRVWEIESGKPIAYIPHKDFVSAIGKMIAYIPHKDFVSAVAFSPKDKKLIATASLDNKARLWKIREDQPTEVEGAATAIALSSDGQFSAISSSDPKQGRTTAQFWKIDSGYSAIVEISGDKSVNKFITFSRDNKFFATASDDNTVRVWSVPGVIKAASSPVWQFSSESSVEAIALSPDGSRLVVAGADNTARLWDVATQQRLTSWSHEGKINAVAFSPQGNFIATASDDNKVKVFKNAKEFKEEEQLCMTLQHDGGIVAIAFSHNEQYLATGSLDGRGRVWDIKCSQDVVTPVVLSHGGKVNAIAFSSDDKFVATASDDKTARVWKRSDGQEEIRLDHAKPVNAVTFKQDNRKIATASSGETAKVWFWQLKDLRPKACEHIKNSLTETDKLTEKEREICR